MRTWEREGKMLKATDLKFRYGNIEVIHGMSFEAQEGKITVIIGTNGAGKTTLLNAIIGLMPFYEGAIGWKDQSLKKNGAHQVTKLGVALCPEGRKLFSDMTVHENLLMGAYNHDSKTDISSSVKDIFSWFPILKERENQLAGTLSGGEQEMLAIARALMAKPELLMLDEPSWGLAPILVDRVKDIIKEINGRGVTILLVEQNAEMALGLADYVYVMETGKIVKEGTPEDMRQDNKILETYLGV